MRKIDFKYGIEWISVDMFDYKSHENDLIKYDAYLNMESKVKHLASILNKDKDSRRAICFPDGVENPACFSSMQILLDNKDPIVICSFRSQHETLGRPSDEKMIKFLVTKFVEELTYNIDNIEIICNVADYHNY